MPLPEAILCAVIGGFLPAIIWLHFILKEDRRCPEPRHLIVGTFIVGMLSVLLVVPLERAACGAIGACYPHPDFHILTTWAIIEETCKYALAAAFILWRRSIDENIDYVVYMVTIALGFAALENTLFLVGPLQHSSVSEVLLTGNLRFIGASLLHVVASALIGFALAFAFRKSRVVRTLYMAVGVILASALHTLFNFLIILGDDSHTLQALFTVWSGVVVFFALFEILKYIDYRNLPPNTCNT